MCYFHGQNSWQEDSDEVSVQALDNVVREVNYTYEAEKNQNFDAEVLATNDADISQVLSDNPETSTFTSITAHHILEDITAHHIIDQILRSRTRGSYLHFNAKLFRSFLQNINTVSYSKAQFDTTVLQPDFDTQGGVNQRITSR